MRGEFVIVQRAGPSSIKLLTVLSVHTDIRIKYTVFLPKDSFHNSSRMQVCARVSKNQILPCFN